MRQHNSKLNIVLLFLLFAGASWANGFKVVVNPKTSVPKLTKKGIQMIYLGKTRRWDDGKRIALTYQKETKLLNDFSRNCVGKSGRQFVMYWKRMVFTGKGAMPKSLKTDADVMSYVRNTPGAIGFVSAKADTSGLTVVTIDE